MNGDVCIDVPIEWVNDPNALNPLEKTMPTTNTTKARQTRKGNRIARTLKGGQREGKTMEDLVIDGLRTVVKPVDIPVDHVHLTEQEAWHQGLISLPNIAILSDIPYHRWSAWSRTDTDFPAYKGKQIRLGGGGGAPRLYDARELREWYHRASADGVL